METYKIRNGTQVGRDVRNFSTLQIDFLWATECCVVSHTKQIIASEKNIFS
jgi:hypothetical protein